MRVAYLGLGLIGGSVALATRSEDRRVVAWTPDGRGPAAALAAGAIDEVAATREGAVEASDLVVLAASPLDCLAHVRWLGGAGRGVLRDGATVTDVASTKAAITEAAEALGVPFVGGHPMAGLETSGYEAADPDLFRGRPWIVTESVGGGDASVVERLASDAGARVVRMRAAEHDAAVAAISHLPLVASVALVEAVAGVDGEPAPDAALALGLAAGGWESMTRLAKGDVAMATGIALTNGDALTARLHAYRDRIDEWVALLERSDGPDAAELERRFAAARRRATGEGG